MKPTLQNICLCQSTQDYHLCCEPLHTGTPANTAVNLMRSRYTAYVLGLESYLLNTWHTSTRPSNMEAFDPLLKWLGLTIKNSWQQTSNEAYVEFVARYRIGGGHLQRLHETSRFVYENNHWYYIDGLVQDQ
jgi:SEC-C motif domain protein